MPRQRITADSSVLSVVGIVASLLFTAVSLRSETQTRRIGNLLALTQNHRELWMALFSNPGLARVPDGSADLSARAITLDERFYVIMAIQHLHSAYQAMETGLVIKPEGVGEDIRTFFSLPIPRAIWKEVCDLQNENFVAFVDRCLAETREPN